MSGMRRHERGRRCDDTVQALQQKGLSQNTNESVQDQHHAQGQRDPGEVIKKKKA